MRWFWQRRKKEETTATTTLLVETPERLARITSPRASRRTHPLEVAMEPRDALLAFARDLLNAQGARVRVEEDDLVIATFSDGATTRYTTTLARAHAEEETALLTQGAPVLETLFEEASRRARVSTATLVRGEDPAAIAMGSLIAPPGACGRCAGGGHERWQAGIPTCDACPMRHDALALFWERSPVAAQITRWDNESGVELTYRNSGRDRRGRRDEWLRLAFNTQTGARLTPLTLDQLAAAKSGADTPLSLESLGVATERAREAVQPGMEALSAYLAQRVGSEFQRRVEELTATHERLRRERPNDATAISSLLERELSSLADVYAIEVEASLEAVCYITSPVAQVKFETERDTDLLVSVDAGRGVVRSPVCAGCSATVSAGRVCARGHVYCPACAETCAHCGAMRCLSCGETPLAPCSLCRDLTCSACARKCDRCGERFCADHVWDCVEGDQTLCLRDLTLCGECEAPLCHTHAAACSVCGEALCPRHTRACKTGGEVLCAHHSTGCTTCQQPLCSTHIRRCEECGQGACRDDIFTCLGCGRSLCGCSNPTPCATCGENFCAPCHDGTPTCPACRNPAPASDDELAPLRLAAEREPAISLKRAWMMGRNALAQVYISRGLGREEVYIISEQGDIIASRRKGWRA